MSYFQINLNAMKYLKFIIYLFACVLFVDSYAQTTPAKNGNAEQKVVRINPVKTDTNDPNYKKLNHSPKDKMFTPAAGTSKPLTPDQINAKNFFVAGAKKSDSSDYHGAIVDYTKSLDLVKNPITYLKRADANRLVGNFDAAILDATEAMKLQPRLAGAYFIRGVSYYEKGEYLDAKSDLDSLLKRDRTNATAFNFRAAVAFMTQDYKAALTKYNEVVRLDSNFTEIYNNRGMMRHYLQDYKGAIQDYNVALKENPDNAKSYNNRGLAFLMLKDVQSALADFDKAVTLNDKYAEAYVNRGRAKNILGDQVGACTDWQSAYSLGLEDSKELIIKYCK